MRTVNILFSAPHRQAEAISIECYEARRKALKEHTTREETKQTQLKHTKERRSMVAI